MSKSKSDCKRVVSAAILNSIYNPFCFQCWKCFLARERFVIFVFIIYLQLIGSSLLVMYDRSGKCGIWIIDFSKTNPTPACSPITHRLPWSIGNHEDGFLYGLDNLIQVWLLWKQLKVLFISHQYASMNVTNFWESKYFGHFST